MSTAIQTKKVRDTGAAVWSAKSDEELLLAYREGGDKIRGDVAQLPELWRALVLLVYYQGLKYREAAEILDIPVGTVKSRLHSAILKLNEAWLESHPHTND